MTDNMKNFLKDQTFTKQIEESFLSKGIWNKIDTDLEKGLRIIFFQHFHKDVQVYLGTAIDRRDSDPTWGSHTHRRLIYIDLRLALECGLKAMIVLLCEPDFENIINTLKKISHSITKALSRLSCLDLAVLEAINNLTKILDEEAQVGIRYSIEEEIACWKKKSNDTLEIWDNHVLEQLFQAAGNLNMFLDKVDAAIDPKMVKNVSDGWDTSEAWMQLLKNN